MWEETEAEKERIRGYLLIHHLSQAPLAWSWINEPVTRYLIKMTSSNLGICHIFGPRLNQFHLYVTRACFLPPLSPSQPMSHSFFFLPHLENLSPKMLPSINQRHSPRQSVCQFDEAQVVTSLGMPPTLSSAVCFSSLPNHTSAIWDIYIYQQFLLA